MMINLLISIMLNSHRFFFFSFSTMMPCFWMTFHRPFLFFFSHQHQRWRCHSHKYWICIFYLKNRRATSCFELPVSLYYVRIFFLSFCFLLNPSYGNWSMKIRPTFIITVACRWDIDSTIQQCAVYKCADFSNLLFWRLKPFFGFSYS